MDFLKLQVFFMIDGIEVNFIKRHVLKDGNVGVKQADTATGPGGYAAKGSARQYLIDVLRYDRFRLKYGGDAGFYSLDTETWNT
jgi:hypothetical protein